VRDEGEREDDARGRVDVVKTDVGRLLEERARRIQPSAMGSLASPLGPPPM
jgi:hypothetical protein